MAAEPSQDHGARLGHQRRRAHDRLPLRRVQLRRSARQAAAAFDHVRYGDHGVLIDTTPDFRHQALRAQIERVDAILFTHSHADHIMGLDDVRPFNFQQGGEIPIYGVAGTHRSDIRRCFPLHLRRA